MSEATRIEMSDYWSDWGKSGGVIGLREGQTPWEIGSMAPRHVDDAVRQIRTALGEGEPVSQVVERLGSFIGEPHVLQVHPLGQGILLVDDTGSPSANDAVSALKTVTSVAARQRRVIVVAGALEFDGNSDYDTLGSYGALMVRLNVAQVFAVGPDARALFLSVGMEGSWDGESRHCLSIESAYDEVRAFVRPEDVVLVMGSTRLSLFPIVEKLREDLS